MGGQTDRQAPQTSGPEVCILFIRRSLKTKSVGYISIADSIGLQPIWRSGLQNLAFSANKNDEERP